LGKAFFYSQGSETAFVIEKTQECKQLEFIWKKRGKKFCRLEKNKWIVIKD
jgi:hypothetical protein